jgi:hypothetical protein
MRTCLTILTIGFLAATIHAQDIPPPIEWGKIDPHEVGMTTFPADTAATAVILCDYGESFINNDLNVEYHHHKRIRILSEAGYAWGSYAVTTYEEKDRESVSDIEGVTYTRNADGTIARHSRRRLSYAIWSVIARRLLDTPAAVGTRR